MDSRIVVASVALALSFVAQANTVGWWHLDELDEGVSAPDGEGKFVFKNAIDPTKYPGYGTSTAYNKWSYSAGRAPKGAVAFPEGEGYSDWVTGVRTQNVRGVLLRPDASNYSLGSAVVVPNDATLSLTNFTYEIFVKPSMTHAGKYQYLISKRPDVSVSASGFLLHYDANGVGVNFYDCGDGTTTNTYPLTTSMNIIDGRWHHVAMTYDRATTTAKLYVDYACRATNADMPAELNFNAPGKDYGLGSDSVAGGGVYGILDEFRISDKALLPGEFLRAGYDPAPLMFPETIVYQRFLPFPDFFGNTNSPTSAKCSHPLLRNEAVGPDSLGEAEVECAGEGYFMLTDDLPVDNVSTGGIGAARMANTTAVSLRSSAESRSQMAEHPRYSPCWMFKDPAMKLMTSSFTAEFFCRMTNVTRFAQLFVSVGGWQVSVDSGGLLRFNELSVLSHPRVDDGRWHHVALVVTYDSANPDNSTGSLYLDYFPRYTGLNLAKHKGKGYTEGYEKAVGIMCYQNVDGPKDIDIDEVCITRRKLSVGQFLHPVKDGVVCDLTFEPDDLGFGKAWDVSVERENMDNDIPHAAGQVPASLCAENLFASTETNAVGMYFKRGNFVLRDTNGDLPKESFTAEFDFRLPVNGYTNWPSGSTPYLIYQKNSWHIYISSAGLRFNYNGWNQIGTFTSSVRMCDGQWHHAAYVYDRENGPQVRAYVDYKLIGKKNVALNLPATDDPTIYFGRAEYASSHHMKNWWFDNVRIVRKALKPCEFRTSKHVGEGDTLVWASFDRTGDVVSAMDETPTFSGTAWAAGAGRLVDKDEQPIAGREQNRGAIAGGGAYSRLSLIEIPDFTAEFFVKNAAAATDGTDLVALMGPDGTTPIWSVRKTSGGLDVMATPQGGTLTDLGTFAAAPTGWAHVAVSFEPGDGETTVKLYLNHVLADTKTFAGTLAVDGISTSALTFGSFAGAIDEFRITKGVCALADMLYADRLGFTFFLK